MNLLSKFFLHPCLGNRKNPFIFAPAFEGNLVGENRGRGTFLEFIDILTDSVALVWVLKPKGGGTGNRQERFVQINKQHPSRNKKRTWTELGLDKIA